MNIWKNIYQIVQSRSYKADYKNASTDLLDNFQNEFCFLDLNIKFENLEDFVS